MLVANRRIDSGGVTYQAGDFFPDTKNAEFMLRAKVLRQPSVEEVKEILIKQGWKPPGEVQASQPVAKTAEETTDETPVRRGPGRPPKNSTD